jgi:hypothetical protein
VLSFHCAVKSVSVELVSPEVRFRCSTLSASIAASTPMAPARKTAGSRTKKARPAQTLHDYSKVSKPHSITRSRGKKGIKITIEHVEVVASPETPNTPNTPSPQNAFSPGADKKRKKRSATEDSESEAELQAHVARVGKKVLPALCSLPKLLANICKRSKSSFPLLLDLTSPAAAIVR